MNIVSLLSTNVKKTPDKTAIIFRKEKIKYVQLWKIVQTKLTYLRSMGFRKGDKVALFLPNGVEFVFYFHAILMGGGIAIPLASYLKQYEIRTILANCKPSFVITKSDLWKVTLGHQYNVKVILLNQINSKYNMVGDENIEPCRPNSIASINYTYNGSGYPKGAELTHKNYLSAFIGLIRHLGLRKDDIYLAPLPMAHIYSLSLGNFVPILNGATLVISDSYFPSTIIKLIENHNITILISVPSLFNLLKRELLIRKYKLSSLRFMISGGEYLPPNLHNSIEKEFKTTIVQGYGLTECMPIICNVPDGPNKPESLGIPGRKDILIRIVDSKMKEVETGITGEILIKSPTTMKQYHNLLKDTQNTFYKGWLKTGDLGYIDRDGFLHFVGLKKRIYNLSGLKVDPIELELLGKLHPKVKDIKIFTETIKGALPKIVLIAEVLLNNGTKLEEGELEEFYKERIAQYKVPNRIIIRK